MQVTGIKLLLAASILLLAPLTYADDGTSDPDYDYEPPEEIGMVGKVARFMTVMFRRPDHAGSFSTAKKWLYRYIDDSETFYCGCPTDLAARKFDSAVCGYVPKNDSVRARRLEAEHILPAYWIAHFHEGSTCWAKDPVCGDERDCCQDKDPRFKRAHNDLVNLIPAIGELNNARSNYTFDLIAGEPREYGVCDFEVAALEKVTEPGADIRGNDIRGNIARVYFYMRDTYDLTYPKDLADRLDDWDEADPIDEAERTRNEQIQSTQGTSNPYVSVE